MKNTCCICGKKVRFNILLGDTGITLSNGAACFECCKLAGYGKGVFSKMGLSVTSVQEFTNTYNSSPKVKKKMIADQKRMLASQKKAIKTHDDTSDITGMSFAELQSEISKYVIANPGVNLQSDEICYFSTPCSSVRYKNVVVGTTRTSSRIGGGKNGLYSGFGVSQQVNNRQNIAEEYPGNFYLTNKRMICSAVKFGFEIPLAKITSMTTYADGLSVMSSDKTYNVIFQDVERFKRVITINNEIEKKKPVHSITPTVSANKSTNPIDSQTSTSPKEADIPKLLREYKSLLDDGIISEEEFAKKKEQLLGGEISNKDSNTPVTEDITEQKNSYTLDDIIRNKYGKKNKMSAIKYVKDETGWGLKEAKDYVERILG